MARLPHLVRRPWLLLRDLLVDRRRPDLERLAAIEDSEAFVWAILPHAARTFSACIVILPGRLAPVAAVAYLYCRILDTYEDLAPGLPAKLDAMDRFATRFAADLGPGAPAVAAPLEAAPDLDPDPTHLDARDRAHLLLVQRCAAVDDVYRALDPGQRRLVARVVTDMAEGMAWAARTFHDQGEVLVDDEQVLRYCRAVLGNPVVFAVRMARLHHDGSADLPAELEAESLRAGEFIQLANVTRDIEKDLVRGVAYHPDLADALGRDSKADAALTGTVREVREHFLRLALARAPSIRAMVDGMDGGGLSFSRASAVLMLLFTARYWQSCAARCGVTPTRAAVSGPGLLLATLASALSPRRAEAHVSATLAGLAELAGAPSPDGHRDAAPQPSAA